MFFNCTHCNIVFERKRNLKKYTDGRKPFCSNKCIGYYKSKLGRTIVLCVNCNKEFSKKNKEIKKVKNHFCSQSCAAYYNNAHKIKGNRRSKLELYLEKQLTSLYPNLEIHFNRKDAINSELDIYIPSLKLAFELNGIFHYEPIYGEDTLSKIKNNDNRKFQACIENAITLCIIDTSNQKYFKESTSKKFLYIIIDIINRKEHELNV